MLKEVAIYGPSVAVIAAAYELYTDCELELREDSLTLYYKREETEAEALEREQSIVRFRQNELLQDALTLERLRKECPDLLPVDMLPVTVTHITAEHHLANLAIFRKVASSRIALMRASQPAWFK
jgi:hypothetical protein